MGMGYYKLVGKTPVLIDTGNREMDLMEFAKAMEGKARNIRKATIKGIYISTVFLGMDHSFGGKEPVLFETMIFDCPELEYYQTRYCTYDEAVKGHEEAVGEVMLVLANRTLWKKVKNKLYQLQNWFRRTRLGWAIAKWRGKRAMKAIRKALHDNK